MNAARIGVLVLALVAAGAAAFLARGLVSSGDSKQVAPKVVEAPTSEILVASDNIETGGRLTASNMQWQKWPDSAMNPVFITKEKRSQALQSLDGAIARLPIVKGEPIVPDRLVWTKGKGLMSALLEPGMRAVAIRISPETSAGGFILPNDRVDVVLTGRSSGGSRNAVTAETIMRNVRILAIDQRFNEKEGGQVAMGKTATLELTPAQAELIAMAQEEGKLMLSLRGIGDKEIAGGDAADEVEGSVVHVVRFGQPQTVRVK